MGGARVVEQAALDPEAIAREVLALVEDRPALEAMRAGLGGMGANGVAETATDLIRLIDRER